MTYPGPRGRETVRPMIPEIGWLRASAERARVWADADGDRLLVRLEDATRAVRDARAAVRQRTVAEIVEALDGAINASANGQDDRSSSLA